MQPVLPNEGAHIILDGMIHLALALFLIYMTVIQMMGIVPILTATGCQPLLPSLGISGLPFLPNHPTPDKEEAYLAEVFCIALLL